MKYPKRTYIDHEETATGVRISYMLEKRRWWWPFSSKRDVCVWWKKHGSNVWVEVKNPSNTASPSTWQEHYARLENMILIAEDEKATMSLNEQCEKTVNKAVTGIK